MPSSRLLPALALTILLPLTSPPLQAQDQTSLLAMDTMVAKVDAAITRLPFERLPSDGESTQWVDPDGRADNVAVGILSGGGLVGGLITVAHQDAERKATVSPLLDVIDRDTRLRDIFETRVRTSVEQSGFLITRTIRARPMAEAQVARGFALGEERIAFAMLPAKGVAPVTLSWDDRRVLLAGDFRSYTRYDGPRAVGLRGKFKRIMRYVGRDAPAGNDPIAYWAAQDGAKFYAEVERGLDLMLPLAWDTAVQVPAVSRKESTVLQVDGVSRTFPGRLWRQSEDVAYLYNDDGGITIVALTAAP